MSVCFFFLLRRHFSRTHRVTRRKKHESYEAVNKADCCECICFRVRRVNTFISLLWSQCFFFLLSFFFVESRNVICTQSRPRLKHRIFSLHLSQKVGILNNTSWIFKFKCYSKDIYKTNCFFFLKVQTRLWPCDDLSSTSHKRGTNVELIILPHDKASICFCTCATFSYTFFCLKQWLFSITYQILSH